jgi:hypothetical protein
MFDDNESRMYLGRHLSPFPSGQVQPTPVTVKVNKATARIGMWLAVGIAPGRNT